MLVPRGLNFRTSPTVSNGLLGTAKGYCSWRQVAGYFDADGSVHLRTDSPVVLRLGLVWVDSCFDQLLQMRVFLIEQGVFVGNVLQQGCGAYSMQIASPKCCLIVAKLLAPFCFKKKEELTIVTDYYENRIDGTQALSRMNGAVIRGTRVGKMRTLILLPTYAEGKLSVARARGMKSAEARKCRTLC
jgi:hypothetical protein